MPSCGPPCRISAALSADGMGIDNRQPHTWGIQIEFHDVTCVWFADWSSIPGLISSQRGCRTSASIERPCAGDRCIDRLISSRVSPSRVTSVTIQANACNAKALDRLPHSPWLQLPRRRLKGLYNQLTRRIASFLQQSFFSNSTHIVRKP